MPSLRKISTLGLRSPARILLPLCVCVPSGLAVSQAPGVTAVVDVTRAGAPISKSRHGHSLEHGGDTVNAGVWSERLADRKFLYPVSSAAPILPAARGNAIENHRFRNLSTRGWAPVGGQGLVSMDTKAPFIGAKLAAAGKLWRMAPDSIDATVKITENPEVEVEEHTLGALPATVTVRPFSVNIYSYPVQ